MKRNVEIVLTVMLLIASLELAWRRVIWNQSPPELPAWLWAGLLLVNGGVIAAAFTRWRKGPVPGPESGPRG
jgi:hypothetical protein